MATTANQLRRELLVGIRDTDDEIDSLLDQAVKDINSAARKYRNSPARFEKAVIAAIALFWVDYKLLTVKSNKYVAQSFFTYVDNTVGNSMLKVGANQTYMNQIQQLPSAQRPKGKLQLQLEAAHNAGNTAEEARLNKLVDASMRTDAGMSTAVKDEFLKAMRAGKPITMAQAQKLAGEVASSRYADDVAENILTRKSLYDAKSINQRIVTIQRGNERVVADLLKYGIDQNISVNQLARSIQDYVKPAKVTRGNAVNYKTIQAGKKIPKGSINYNAVRIARTEIMQTYDQAARDFYDDKPWLQGWDWFLSNTHAGQDDCDTLAAQSPHKKLPDRPHPQCTCNPQPRVPTLKEFGELVKSGKIV